MKNKHEKQSEKPDTLNVDANDQLEDINDVLNNEQ